MIKLYFFADWFLENWFHEFFAHFFTNQTLILYLIYFQERYERIHEELRHLSDRMEELKTAATHARDANDLNALHNIGQQIEMIQNRQALLLREQHQERQIRAR